MPSSGQINRSQKSSNSSSSSVSGKADNGELKTLKTESWFLRAIIRIFICVMVEYFSCFWQFLLKEFQFPFLPLFTHCGEYVSFMKILLATVDDVSDRWTMSSSLLLILSRPKRRNPKPSAANFLKPIKKLLLFYYFLFISTKTTIRSGQSSFLGLLLFHHSFSPVFCVFVWSWLCHHRRCGWWWSFLFLCELRNFQFALAAVEAMKKKGE